MLNTCPLPASAKGMRINPVTSPAPILSLDITVDYPHKKHVLRGARLEVYPGEILGLVGHSGSGKSTLALAVLQLLGNTGAHVSGRVMLLEHDLAACGERQLRDLRGRVASLVPQSPALALNPVLRLGTQLAEAWRAHSKAPWSQQTERLRCLLHTAGLPPEDTFLRRFPSQISIGQAQRVLIVMALLHSPSLLIADEPTSALDAITQREVLDLLVKLANEQRMSILFISHDLLTVATVCHRVAILHGGEIVECGPVKEIVAAPRHPYTKRLIAAAPKWNGLVYTGDLSFGESSS